MKKLFLSAFAFMNIGVSTFAHTTLNPRQEAVVQENKTPVKIAELPEAVKNILKEDIYEEWIPISAQLVKVNGSELFTIEMQKGLQTATLKIDKDGKIIR